jgi:hypothetical protein
MADGTVGACHRLDTELMEKVDRPSSHPAGQHHVHSLFVDKARHLPRLVLGVERVGNSTNLLDLSPFQID